MSSFGASTYNLFCTNLDGVEIKLTFTSHIVMASARTRARELGYTNFKMSDGGVELQTSLKQAIKNLENCI